MIDKDFLEAPFSHIYVEEGAMTYPVTRRILGLFPGSRVIVIRHYKDIFNRKRQERSLAHRCAPLILAKKEKNFLYGAAPVCQDFGNAHFYYASCMMNCLFDCEYCYLKGMYPSGYNVIFVNIEDYFAETERLLEKHPVYLCVSYDTDLMAAEQLTGYTAAWSGFAGEHAAVAPDGNGISIEIRTKSANAGIWERLRPYQNVIYAFTLSPQSIIDSCEHGTPSLKARLLSAGKAMSLGFPVRLCFDPVLFCSDWRNAYSGMIDETAGTLDMGRVKDISVGSFRISGEYLKQMRRMEPRSAVVQYPYECSGGYCHYGRELMDEMEGFLVRRLSEYTESSRIFRWS